MWQTKVVLIVVLLAIEVRLDTVTDLIDRHPRYRGEAHTVTTRDGYILTLHRVIGRSLRNQPDRVVSAPVLLVHGLFASAGDWVVLGPGKALGFVLSDYGHDVWLVNCRGNLHSKRHTFLNTTSFAFWDFSFHELGTYDGPAIIDYVLKMRPDRQHVYWIGHSQGVATSLAMLAERPRYNERVAAVFGLSPVAYLGDLTSPPVKALASLTTELSLTLRKNGFSEFLPYTAILGMFTEMFCNEGAITQELCITILGMAVGRNSAGVDRSILGEFVSNLPAGASTKQLLHLGQLIQSGRFQKFDYTYRNKSRNIEVYGRAEPPEYNLTRVTTVYNLFYGENDSLLGASDAERLRRQLPNVTKFRGIANWNHLDFMYAQNAVELYREIAEDINKAESR